MPRPKSYEEKKLRALYMQGLSDIEIAKRLEISQKIVGNWRRDNKVPPNSHSAQAEPEVEQLPSVPTAAEGLNAPPATADVKTEPMDEPPEKWQPISAVTAAFTAAVAAASGAQPLPEAEPEPPEAADITNPMTAAQLAEALVKLAQLAPDAPVLLRSGDTETAASAVRVTVTYHNAPGESVAACIS